MKNISRQMRSSPQASGVKLPKNASKPPPSRLCSHLDSQFSHNAPPSHCDETKGWIAKNGTSVNGRYIHPTHRGGFYHGPPRDPSKSFQVLGPLGWQTQTSSPNMATTLQPLEPCRSFELRKGTKKKRPCSKLQFSCGESCCPSLGKAKSTRMIDELTWML